MKALVFDVDDTLYDQLQPFRRALLDHLVLGEEMMGKIYLASRRYSDLVFEASEKGKMSLEEMHLYRLKHALEDFGFYLSDEVILEIQRTYKTYQQQIELDPFMKEALDYCWQEGILLGVITNGPAQHQAEKVQQLHLDQWIPDERIIISGQVGWMKPQSEIFHLLERQLPFSKSEIVYVGDSYENDVKGAHAAGWQSIWLNTRNKKVVQPPPLATYEINHRSQLLPLLKEMKKESYSAEI